MTQGSSHGQDAKAARLKAALKANMARRKGQARARAALPDMPDDAAPSVPRDGAAQSMVVTGLAKAELAPHGTEVAKHPAEDAGNDTA